MPVQPSLDGDWPAAGHKRNTRMLLVVRPHHVLAFWDGRTEGCGTLNCMKQANDLGIPLTVRQA